MPQPPTRVLQSPAKVLRLERRVTLASPLWRGRWVLLALAGAYSTKGALDLVLLERRHWAIPFTNDRRLLLAHFGCAAPFLLATLLQKWLIPWVGERPTERAIWHRFIGRFAVLCGGRKSHLLWGVLHYCHYTSALNSD